MFVCELKKIFSVKLQSSSFAFVSSFLIHKSNLYVLGEVFQLRELRSPTGLNIIAMYIAWFLFRFN